MILCGKSKRGLRRTDDIGRELSGTIHVEANARCLVPMSEAPIYTDDQTPKSWSVRSVNEPGPDATAVSRIVPGPTTRSGRMAAV